MLQNLEIVDRDGTVYLLGKSMTREKEDKEEGGKYQFELYKIKSDSQETMIFDSSKNFIGSLTVVVNEDQLFCVGFYSEKKDFRYKGIAFFDVNVETLGLKGTVYSPFTDQFIMDKFGKEKDKELRNIFFRDILVTADNEVIVNAEEYYTTVMYSQEKMKTIYHFDDMVSVKLGSDGNLIYARNINKKESARYFSPYLSFTSTYYNGKTYIFLNGSDKIKKLRKDRMMFKGTKSKKSNVYVVTLDANGDFEYMKLVDDKDSPVPFAVGQGFLQGNGKNLFFQGLYGKKKQMLKIEL